MGLNRNCDNVQLFVGDESDNWEFNIQQVVDLLINN